MGVKLKKIEHLYIFRCPGCEKNHPFDTKRWSFNDDLEKPTFKPSLLVNADPHRKNPDRYIRCHSFVTDGKIQFLGDCSHDLKNQTVEIPDWEDDFF